VENRSDGRSVALQMSSVIIIAVPYLWNEGKFIN